MEWWTREPCGVGSAGWELWPPCGTPTPAPAHLKALGVHFLALLVPGHPWLGIACGLAYEGGHASRHTDLVLGLFDKPGWLWRFRRGEL